MSITGLASSPPQRQERSPLNLALVGQSRLQLPLRMNPSRCSRERLHRLRDLPNVGPAMARDLELLGFTRPGDLVGQDPVPWRVTPSRAPTPSIAPSQVPRTERETPLDPWPQVPTPATPPPQLIPCRSDDLSDCAAAHLPSEPEPGPS